MTNRVLFFFFLLTLGFVSGINAQYRLLVMEHNDPDVDELSNEMGDQISEQGSNIFFGGQNVSEVGAYGFQNEPVDYSIHYALYGDDVTYGDVACHCQTDGDIGVGETFIFNGSSLNVNQYGSRGPCHITYKAVLVSDLEVPIDNERCGKDFLFNESSINTEIGYWEYSTDNNTWHTVEYLVNNVPTIYRNYPLRLPLDQIIGVSDDYTGAFHVRFTFEGYTSAPINFEIILCSPELASPITPIAEECPGAEDGSFTMILDRNLDQNELLFVALYLANDENQIFENGGTETLTDNQDGTYSFTWPDNLSPGNLAPGDYMVRFQSRHQNGQNEPWNSLEISPEFTIGSPTPVTYTLDVVDVNCLGGGDGQIIIEASGGSEGNYQFSLDGGQTWDDFENDDNHTIMDLDAEDYTVEVRDENECVGTIDDNEVTVGQPEEAINFPDITIQDATAFGFTNGSINVNVSGGTEGYTYEWTDGNNNTIDTGAAQQINGVYQIILEDVAADTYTLTVWDSGYDPQANQNNKQGCTHFDSFVVDEPPPLQLSVQETIPISCNSANTFNNPYNDGQLTAVASGGVPPYDYFWKKKNGNQWLDIPNQNTNVLSNLDAGEYAVNIEDAHGIVVGIYANNQFQQAQDVVYELEEPDLLEVELIKTDVNCFGGADGTATVSITGGTPPYEIFWATGESTETIENLAPANYWVQVTDARGCQAEGEINIEQPAEAVSLSDGSIQEPLAFGFTNGSVTAYVTGGTPYPNNSYDYEWLDKDNNTINTTTAQPTQQGYQIVLEDIPSGTYTLVVKDANYNNAIQKEGCTYSRDYVVTEPPPLEVTILPAGISCNSANMFNNPTDDGQLTAIASGGVPFEPLIDGLYSYLYTWKRKDANGIWQVIPNNHTNLLDNVGEGEYAVNIEDANGIILGTYVNNVLQEAEDHVFLLEEPEQLILELDKTDVSCFGGSDGTATISISGGIPPYEIFWSNNGASTQTANSLAAGTYWVYVMDALGCEVSAQVSIEEPEALTVQLIEQIDPTCNDIDNGSIALAISGGQPPYTYQWNTGEGTTSLSGLFEGIYTFEVIDANGCVQFFETELKSPLSSFDGLGEDKVLCKNQIADFDVSIEDPNATYLWTSNFGFYSTSPAVSISEPGVYTATVTSALSCSESDSITIQTSNVEIDSQFLITSQAFAKEEVVLVNTSNPLGTSEEWIFPEDTKIHEKDRSLAIISFDEPGVYEVILRSYQGECYQDYTKNIVVAEARELPDVGDTIKPFIKEFMVYPNPSSGTFTVVVSLQEQSTVSLRMFSLTNNYVYDERLLQGSANYETPYEMDLTSGVYLLLLETSKGNEIRKIVIL
ncbi:MAG: T9SS type A sorting domain-containing protein [Allomuricauda sp.]